METSEVKQRIVATMERAKRRAADRRARAAETSRSYDVFLDRLAIPLFRQVANVLRSEKHLFTVFTPGGSVRLMSDRSAQDYIELTLEAGGDETTVAGHTSRSRGGRVIETERPIGDPATLTEEDVLAFVLKELEPFVER
jgi:hypothetical protein